MWLIMDIYFVSDGWSHARNPGRLPGGSGMELSDRPNLAEVMARQTELLNLLVQA
jgi:hypothetical protein